MRALHETGQVSLTYLPTSVLLNFVFEGWKNDAALLVEPLHSV